MANTGTIIIRRSLNRDSKSSLSIKVSFNIIACLSFFLLRIVISGLVKLLLSYLINFWAFLSLIYIFSNYLFILATYILRPDTLVTLLLNSRALRFKIFVL
jgi:hypothetical protein